MLKDSFMYYFFSENHPFLCLYNQVLAHLVCSVMCILFLVPFMSPFM